MILDGWITRFPSGWLDYRKQRRNSAALTSPFVLREIRLRVSNYSSFCIG
jgi:hypothetical protein